VWIYRRTLLRGLAKFVAVVLAAGLAGAGIGIVLAKLSGNDGGDTPALPAAASATSAQAAPTTQAQPPPPSAARTETTPSSVAKDTTPSVRVLSALLGRQSYSTGRALVAARVRLTNRARRPLVVGSPALLSGQDEVPPNAPASSAATSFPRTVAPGASATGTLRFTISPEIAQRLNADLAAARLRIAKRVVALRLTKG
jgi:hypothetical protein